MRPAALMAIAYHHVPYQNFHVMTPAGEQRRQLGKDRCIVTRILPEHRTSNNRIKTVTENTRLTTCVHALITGGEQRRQRQGDPLTAAGAVPENNAPFLNTSYHKTSR